MSSPVLGSWNFIKFQASFIRLARGSMGVEGINSKSESKGESTRRTAAMVVAIGFHLALMVVLLRPGAAPLERFSAAVNDTPALKLRFLTRPAPPVVQVANPPQRSKGLPPRMRQKQPNSSPPIFDRAATAIATQPQTNSTQAAIQLMPAAPSTPSFTDGGFRQRLLDAQHSADVHGVPGSDLHLAPGIELIDPAKQGVGAVMRRVQRLFGIPSRHCIDVDTWKNLTPVELIARHLTARDVEEAIQKYQCNRPLGLSF